MSFAEARDLFREQVTALVEAGVDLIILESFRDLDELREAVLAVREAAGREMPLIAQVAIEDDGTIEDGTSAANIALASSTSSRAISATSLRRATCCDKSPFHSRCCSGAPRFARYR